MEKAATGVTAFPERAERDDGGDQNPTLFEPDPRLNPVSAFGTPLVKKSLARDSHPEGRASGSASSLPVVRPS
jgi:hypothetical protein